jgi:hypothetical protein
MSPETSERNIWEEGYPPEYFTSHPVAAVTEPDVHDRAPMDERERPAFGNVAASQSVCEGAQSEATGQSGRSCEMGGDHNSIGMKKTGTTREKNVMGREALESITRAQDVAINAGAGACFRERGNRTLMALAKYRNNGDLRGLLTSLYYPSPPPKMSQLLVLTLLAAGILDKKPDNFINMDSF